VAKGSSRKKRSPMTAEATPTLYGLLPRIIGLPIRFGVSAETAT
jgi:hypothetical protein